MPKNIVVCCDGTANEFARDRTNVIKLFYTLIHDPSRQVAFYHPGLGTMEAAGALTTFSRKLTKLAGLAIGYGLETDIRDAYVFLMNYFEEGDRLFLFGFSRGAYTARAVASLLHMYGLIRKGDEPLVPYAIRMQMAINRAQGRTKANQPSQVRALFKLADEFKAHFSGTPCGPYFVGVWDTVSSVGWIENPLRLPYTANNPDIQIGRHAIAIDERRAFFRPNLWRPTATGGPRDLKQVWFPGAHSDVGGGYPEAESGLSKVALEWMLREAASAGLMTDPAKLNRVLGRSDGGYVPPDPKAAMHEALTPAWWGAEFIPKRYYNWDRHREERGMNLLRRRTIPDGSMIHDAAYQRGADYRKLLPAHAVRVS